MAGEVSTNSGREEKNAFIGLDALQEVATQVGTQIVMGPAYVDPDLMKRLRINVISGVQYKHVKTLLVRKGGTTRRKVVGQKMQSGIGFLKERELIAKLSWNRFVDNIDNYVETAFGTDGKPGGDYPLSTTACEAILRTYAEDLADCLFFGDMALDDNKEGESGETGALALYDGFHTLIAKDIEAGIVSVDNHNLIECDAIEAPDASDFDSTPFDTVMEIYLKLDPRMRRRELLCYCDVNRGVYIAQGYANKSHGYAKVHYNEDGTFTIPEMPRLTFVPTDVFGKGDRLVFTIPDNFEYGVDSLSNQTFVKVQLGSDDDAQDVIFQIQSIQGCRIVNPLSSAFAVTNGSITSNPLSGDGVESSITILAQEGEVSKITINGEEVTDKNSVTKKVADKSINTVEVTAAEGYEFKRWNNGATANPLNVVATGFPLVLSPILVKKGE